MPPAEAKVILYPSSNVKAKLPEIPTASPAPTLKLKPTVPPGARIARPGARRA